MAGDRKRSSAIFISAAVKPQLQRKGRQKRSGPAFDTVSQQILNSDLSRDKSLVCLLNKYMENMMNKSLYNNVLREFILRINCKSNFFTIHYYPIKTILGSSLASRKQRRPARQIHAPAGI
jgi:hypothetical protein